MKKYYNESSKKKLLSFIVDQRFPLQFRSELILRSFTEQFLIFNKVLKWDKVVEPELINHISGYIIKELKRDILSEYLLDVAAFNKRYSTQFNIVLKIEKALEDILFRTATLLNPIIQDAFLTKKEIYDIKKEQRIRQNKKNKNISEGVKQAWSENKKSRTPDYLIIVELMDSLKINLNKAAGIRVEQLNKSETEENPLPDNLEQSLKTGILTWAKKEIKSKSVVNNSAAIRFAELHTSKNLKQLVKQLN